MDDLIPRVVVIPTRDRRVDLLPLLIEDLLHGDDCWIIVMDNSDEQDAAAYLPDSSRLLVHPSPGAGIYQMWNVGWGYALGKAEFGAPVDVAFLNDDLRVPPNLVGALSDALRSDDDVWASYPDYRTNVAEDRGSGAVVPTFGVLRHGGMCGFCFMIRGELLNRGLEPFNEDFNWWFGDDDIAFQIARAEKKIVRVERVGIEHVGGGSQSRHRSNRHGMVDADKARAAEEWGQ